jgi:hypothetical protein
MGLDEVPLVEIVRMLKSKKVMGETASTVVSHNTGLQNCRKTSLFLEKRPFCSLFVACITKLAMTATGISGFWC